MAVSDYDKQHLSEAQQATIAAVTQAAQSGSMSWADAHAAAEAVRAQAGYSGGQYGNEYNAVTPSSSGNSGGSVAGGGAYAGTNYHQDAIDAAQKYASSGNYDDWQAVLDALTARGEKVSATGNDYGNTNAEILESLMGFQMAGDNRYYQNQAMQMLQQLQMQAPVYTPSWGDQAYEDLLQQAIAMNYEDWTESDQYQALADRFGIQGKMTMQDVLGQISSRTGGLASSYATTAAQQQYNEYMSQLEEVARQMFAGERSDVIENAGLAREYGEQEYARYLDQLNIQNDRNSAALGIINQMMGYTSDQINNKYAQDQTARAEAQDRVNAYLAAYGNVADLDPSLIRNSGYTQSELDTIARYYADQRAQEQAAAAKKNTGGGTDGGGDPTPQKPTLTAAQTLTALENGIVNDTTKAAYEYYYGQPWEDAGAGNPGNTGDAGADATISNRHGDSWIYIPGHGRFSYQEVENYVNSGQVIETYDAATNTYSYKWNNNYK